MLCRFSQLWLPGSICLWMLVGWPSATRVAAQEAATVEKEAPGETESEPVDPYQVPEGSIDELFQYLQQGPRLMQPRNREDAVRMFQSLDTAAENIYTAPEATTEQRIQAAGLRVMLHTRLAGMGVPNAAEELTAFLEQVAADPAPELQQLAKQTILDQKIASWPRLDAGQREAVLDDLRSGLIGEHIKPSSLVALMKLADGVAGTPAVPQVVALIEEVRPALESAEDPAIAQRVPRLEGLIRRLQLPGTIMEVEGTLLGGEMVDWESYRGKVVLVDYWATWCGPCIAELPNVLAAYAAYHDKGFEVLGISLDSDKEAVENFFEARNIPWQTLYSTDPEANGWAHPMAEKYAIAGIPQAILVDKEGKVVSMNARGRTLEKALSELLGPAEAAADSQPEAGGEAPKTAAIAP